jgi:hypothetical protein
MAIKQSTRYETTNGTLYTSEKDAQRAQDALNKTDRKNFRLKIWKEFVNEQLGSKDEEIRKIYGNLTRGKYGVSESKGIFERLWLGTVTNTLLNQRPQYEKMLNTIVGEDETHIKADGLYDFTIGEGAKAIMTRSKEEPYTLSASYGDMETYTLQESPNGFTLSNGRGTIGTSTFVNNVWSVVFKENTHTIRWQAGL